jgi:hypothetical protein
MMDINQRGKHIICKRDSALRPEHCGNAMQMMFKVSPLQYSPLEEIAYQTSSVARDVTLANIPSRSLMYVGFRRTTELVFGIWGDV